MAGMILAWGRPDDGPVQCIHAALARRGRADAFILVDQRRYARVIAEVELPAGWVEVDGRRVDLADVTGILVRPYPPVEQEAGEVSWHDLIALEGALLAIADQPPPHTVVVNPPAAMAGNDSKPAQTAAIAATGWFAVPETVVTNDRAVAEAFCAEHDAVVYKSTSGVRSIATRMTPRHHARFDRLATCPTQFQAFVPGTDYRVHVVGDAVFTVAIHTDAVDYRYAGREGVTRAMTAATLPDEVAEHCVALTRHLGLTISGIDLRQTPDGAWFCFEVNTSPAFSWFEQHTGLPIADAVASLMLAGKGVPFRP